MANITDSLKELYVAFGGNADDVSTIAGISEILNAITIQLGGDSESKSIAEAIQNLIPVVPTNSSSEFNAKVGADGIEEFYDETTTYLNANAYKGNVHLTKADFAVLRCMDPSTFEGCTRLETLILRGNNIAEFDTNPSSCLQGTAIRNGTGYIYVPDNLVDGYKAARGWTIDAAQIKGISELPTD